MRFRLGISFYGISHLQMSFDLKLKRSIARLGLGSDRDTHRRVVEVIINA